MKVTSCPTPVDVPTLAQYWLGELDPSREDAVEAHVFQCAHCTQELDRLVAIGSGIRELVRNGEVLAVVTDAFVGRLAAQGVRLNEYRVPRNGSVYCTVAPDDEVAVARLEAPLRGVERIDVLLGVVEGVPHERLQDVPFDPAAGEIVVTPRIARLRALPAGTSVIQLVAVTSGGEEMIGEYRFNHAPWGDLPRAG